MRLLNGNEFAMAGRAGVEGGGRCRGSARASPCLADSALEEGAGGDAQRVVLALFLGGCTFSEIAALRFLGKERGRTGHYGGGGAAPRAPSTRRCAVPRLQVHLPDHRHYQQRPHDGGHGRGQGVRPGGGRRWRLRGAPFCSINAAAPLGRHSKPSDAYVSRSRDPC